ncbi:MAG: hypothetical protein AB1847_23550 [bacterium]
MAPVRGRWKVNNEDRPSYGDFGNFRMAIEILLDMQPVGQKADEILPYRDSVGLT